MQIASTPKMISQRLDAALADALPQLTRRSIRDLINAGKLERNGQTEFRPHYKVQEGDVFELEEVEAFAHRAQVAPHKMSLEVLYDDGGLVAINKPAGISVHPTREGEVNTVLNGLHYVLKDKINPAYGVTLLHRLDRDTSGVLAVAITPEANRHYARQFAEHRVGKEYTLLVAGNWRAKHPESFTVSNYLKYDFKTRTQKAVASGVGGAQFAKTEFLYQEYLKSHKYTRLIAIPTTGRTHQIRVHAMATGFPIVGDTKYGGIEAVRLMLHASVLKLKTLTDQDARIVAPLPPEFVE